MTVTDINNKAIFMFISYFLNDFKIISVCRYHLSHFYRNWGTEVKCNLFKSLASNDEEKDKT